MTSTQRKVLTQAAADGGTVALSGMDKHPGWNKRHVSAAIWLHGEGLGIFRGGNAFEPDQFEILPAGRRALRDS